METFRSEDRKRFEFQISIHPIMASFNPLSFVVCAKNINYSKGVSSSGLPVLSSLACLPSSFHRVTVCRLLFPLWDVPQYNL